MALSELGDAPSVGVLLEQSLDPAGGQTHLPRRVGDQEAAAFNQAHGAPAAGVAGRAGAVGGSLAALADGRGVIRRRGGERGWHRAPPFGGGQLRRTPALAAAAMGSAHAALRLPLTGTAGRARGAARRGWTRGYALVATPSAAFGAWPPPAGSSARRSGR